jgi:hypothetical protein
MHPNLQAKTTSVPSHRKRRHRHHHRQSHHTRIHRKRTTRSTRTHRNRHQTLLHVIKRALLLAKSRIREYFKNFQSIKSASQPLLIRIPDTETSRRRPQAQVKSARSKTRRHANHHQVNTFETEAREPPPPYPVVLNAPTTLQNHPPRLESSQGRESSPPPSHDHISELDPAEPINDSQAAPPSHSESSHNHQPRSVESSDSFSVRSLTDPAQLAIRIPYERNSTLSQPGIPATPEKESEPTQSLPIRENSDKLFQPEDNHATLPPIERKATSQHSSSAASPAAQNQFTTIDPSGSTTQSSKQREDASDLAPPQHMEATFDNIIETLPPPSPSEKRDSIHSWTETVSQAVGSEQPPLVPTPPTSPPPPEEELPPPSSQEQSNSPSPPQDCGYD